jgi:biopolymer transport protein ExbB
VAGADIRFTLSSNPTPLAYEIESWSGGGGAPVTASIWVKIPAISAATGAELWMYYNNPTAADAQNASAVWSNDYRLVAHLPDLTTLTVKDSTQYNMTLTKYLLGRPVENDGVIAKCQDGSALSSWITGENTPAIDITEAPLTISAWINKTSVAYGWIAAKNNNLLTDVQFGIDSYPDVVNGRITIFLEGIQRAASALGSLLLNTWTHAAFTWDGSTVQAYIDGLPSGTPGAFSGSLTSRPNFNIGKRQPNAAWLIGLYDEVRIAAAARSAAWLKFQFANQDSIDNELTFGSVQTL